VWQTSTFIILKKIMIKILNNTDKGLLKTMLMSITDKIFTGIAEK